MSFIVETTVIEGSGGLVGTSIMLKSIIENVLEQVVRSFGRTASGSFMIVSADSVNNRYIVSEILIRTPNANNKLTIGPIVFDVNEPGGNGVLKKSDDVIPWSRGKVTRVSFCSANVDEITIGRHIQLPFVPRTPLQIGSLVYRDLDGLRIYKVTDVLEDNNIVIERPNEPVFKSHKGRLYPVAF